MKTGKIMEIGTHNTLLQDFPAGIYSNFVREQEKAEDTSKNNAQNP
jgi:ABC-type multidrug transport system fused ATPase/permease subunit